MDVATMVSLHFLTFGRSGGLIEPASYVTGGTAVASVLIRQCC
jgi:hypothetical protein